MEAPQAGGAYPEGMLLEDKVQLLQVIPPVSRPHTGHDVVRNVGCAKGTLSSQLHHHQLVSKIMTICRHMSWKCPPACGHANRGAGTKRNHDSAEKLLGPIDRSKPTQ